MRGFGIIAGIMMSIMGGYAFFMEMDLFVRLGWMLGIVFILNSFVLLFPLLREKGLAKFKTKQNLENGSKKDYTNNILGWITLIVGILIFIAGVAKTLTGLALVYVVGSCVMFYGWLPLSKLTKKPEVEAKEKQQQPVKRKKKKKAVQIEEKKESNKTLIICSVISLALGALAICNNFIETLDSDRIVAYSLVMQGIDNVLLAIDTYKKKA